MSLKALRELAASCGIETSYLDMHGQRVAAAPETLQLALAAFGIEVRRVGDAPRLLAGRRRQARARRLPPVLVAWGGKLALPACTLVGEDGRERQHAPGKKLPFGYWTMAAAGAKCTIVSAPRRTHPLRPARGLGFFLPLYAMRSGRNLGIGDFGDLARLLDWTKDHGGTMAGTLPFLALFLADPCEPSPYSPASRLFWNEVHLDLERVPEMLAAPRVRARLDAAAMQRTLRRLRAAPRVEYARVAALKTGLLAGLARAFFATPGSARHAAFDRFCAGQPLLGDYAAFRAQGDPALADQHRYAQFLCHEQLSTLAAHPVGLYLDLPIGTHPDGYDLARFGAEFARGATVGAPPDHFFRSGQDWGLPPLHPVHARAEGWRYWRLCLRHQMRFARCLRIDHVMGLHRLFWIPAGGEAKDGLYVRYPHEELYAIVCLESHLARCAVAGEDLGLVPDEVRAAMRRHGMLRLYVLPWELRDGRPRPVPAQAIASLDTHDMLPFAAQPGAGGLVDRLRFLGRSKARLVLVNVEDLWGETEPQNVPGTVGDANWTRKARHELGRWRPGAELRRALRRRRD